MQDDGDARPSADRETLIRAVIGSWRDSLINLTEANRLLNFQPSRTGMIIMTRPAGGDVLARLAAGGGFTFRSLRAEPAGTGPAGPDVWTPAAAPPPPAADILDTDSTPDELAAALRALTRRSSTEYLDRGRSVLYLAFGTLTWTGEDRARYASPLLLVPVRLVAADHRQLPALEPTDDDPVINEALSLKLSRRGITLPRVDDLAEVTLDGLLDAVRDAVAGRDGWRVGEHVVLSCFSFANEAIYRDLLEHEDLAAAHPAVAALAAGGRAGGGAGFGFSEITDDEIDTRAAPETTPVILDADSSQRAAIAAALTGRSFVLDGAPGTGKSQTIANMIGVLLHAGKTVLFVSGKAAALDVVRDRLTDAGLGAYLLELHSRGATRKEVAVSLGKALDTVPVAPAPMPRRNVDTARQRREQLSAYADAMNRPREPLGCSLHDVLGMIANLHGVPAAPTTGRAPVDLTPKMFGEIQDTADTLAAAWRPAAQGQSFVWRGVIERGSIETRLYEAGSALEVLAGLARANETLAGVTGLKRPSDAAALARLLGHLGTWPLGLPDEWLTTGTLEAVAATVTQIAAVLSEIDACESEAARAVGAAWSAIPGYDNLPAIDGDALAALAPACADPGGLTAEQIGGLSRTLAADADMLEKRLGTLSGLASMLGLQPPASFSEAADLLAIAQLADEPDRPQRAWLSGSGLQAAQEAGHALADAQRALATAEADASAYYTAGVLQEDVHGLARRFGSEHHRLGKLSAEYRADKRAVAALTREGIDAGVAHGHLELAVAWKRAAQALAIAETSYASLLGPYYAGPATDFDRLGRALGHAATAVERAHGQDLWKAADHICGNTRPNPMITSMAAEVRQDLSAWQGTLARPPLTAARPELLTGTIREAIGWLRAHLGPLRADAVFTQGVDEVVGQPGQPLTFRQSRHLVDLRTAVDAAHARLTAQHGAFLGVCGGLYAGVQTDVTALRAALDWTRHLRAMFTGGPAGLTPAHLKAAESAVPTAQLPAAVDAWCQAKDALLAAFSPDRREELASELDDYRNGSDLINAMWDDVGGRDDWHVYQAAYASLAACGLAEAVDFCIAQHVPAAQVPRVIERALLQEWAEHHLRTDPDLAAGSAADRDALVGEYQELDRALIAAATGDIIRACNARRPRSDIGEAAVIHREAEKKRRHLPVRMLIDRARHVAQAIKPCFLMSPLAVSQYLPADMHFDVVIFDEASQVGPGEAIGCIYRGSSHVLAGDQRQLPPASFLSSAALDGAEQRSGEPGGPPDSESILDLAKGTYRSLTLRSHYRSRDEALIAFANGAFYSGRLATFSSSHREGAGDPDAGVELFAVDGTYRRGAGDNPAEAARVAERVVHHYDTRPDLSLGVVTFSEAQAAAVEAAVAEARQHRPDLDRFFAGDRLQGFFVKDVEMVQGDERDVVILSVGYGPDESGQLAMDFGPLSSPGGWRRLNVATTRARYRNEIVSSIRVGDIPGSVTGEGAQYLRRYLDYAARGRPALALGTSGDVDSPLEESVIGVIRSWGYELTPQVGTAGYRIDIGVHHPGRPGGYALGVECDGYHYHSARAARDRDRLRAQVLRDRGWQLHRIWGTAWYRDRGGEERRLRAAIEQAIAAPDHGLPGGAGPAGESARPVIQTEAATFDAEPAWARPYETATVPALPHWVDPADPSSRFTMAGGIRAVVTTEAPVHISVLHQRLRDAWHIGRIGTRISDNLDDAIGCAGVIREGDFLTFTDAPRTVVRTPTLACERTVDQVHEHELELALVGLVRDARSIGRSELTARVARLYGWTRCGPDITGRMEELISDLCRNGTLGGDERSLTVPVVS